MEEVDFTKCLPHNVISANKLVSLKAVILSKLILSVSKLHIHVRISITSTQCTQGLKKFY